MLYGDNLEEEVNNIQEERSIPVTNCLQSHTIDTKWAHDSRDILDSDKNKLIVLLSQVSSDCGMIICRSGSCYTVFKKYSSPLCPSIGRVDGKSFPSKYSAKSYLRRVWKPQYYCNYNSILWYPTQQDIHAVLPSNM